MVNAVIPTTTNTSAPSGNISSPSTSVEPTPSTSHNPSVPMDQVPQTVDDNQPNTESSPDQPVPTNGTELEHSNQTASGDNHKDPFSPQNATPDRQQISSQDPVLSELEQIATKTTSPEPVSLNVLPPLSQMNQGIPLSTPPAPPTPNGVPQPPQPPNQSGSNLAAPPAYSGTPAEDQSVSILKLIWYFLLGLLTSVITFLPVMLWLGFKSKSGTKRKAVAYFAGIGVIILIMGGLETFLKPYFQEKLIEAVPALGYVPATLAPLYPQATFTANVNYVNDFTDGAESKTSELEVIVQDFPNMTNQDFKMIGATTCETINFHNDHFDSVKVGSIQTKKIAVLSTDFTQGAQATCDEWINDPPPNIPLTQ